MGGNAGGAQASAFVLGELASASEEETDDLRKLLLKTNQMLIERSRNDPVAPKMATTLTGVYFNGSLSRLVHVGNTRAFARQGDYLKQITSDHTTYNLLKSSGQLEAANACNKSEITNCFGGGDPALLSRVSVCDLPPFSLLLLTSDGVHEYVDIDELEEILRGNSTFAEKCKLILERAIETGSEDDMTVVIVCPKE